MRELSPRSHGEIIRAGKDARSPIHERKETMMVKRMLIGAAAVAVAVALMHAGGVATPLTQATSAEAATNAQTREFEGRVVRINRSNKTFVQWHKRQRMVLIQVNNRTRWEEIRGFGALRVGMKVETDARYNGKRWVATKVERDD
jgi:hypothetical protein